MVICGHSWSVVVIRGHSWSFVVILVTPGHLCDHTALDFLNVSNKNIIGKVDSYMHRCQQSQRAIKGSPGHEK